MPGIASIKTSSILEHVCKTTDAAIGVNKTFDPEGFLAPGVAKWVDRSGGYAVGFPSMTLQVRPPTKNGGRVYKVMMKLDVPTMDITAPTTVTGIQPAPSKAYSCVAILDLLLPERSSLAERTALFSLLKSFFEDTITASDGAPTDATGSPLKAAVLNFDAPY
jgi:hypothetical protein